MKPRSSRLSKSQLRALEDLEDAIQSIQRWHRKTHKEAEDDEAFLLAYGDWEKQMLRAVRAGLIEHPAVHAFVETRRSLGSWKLLRRARSGVEKGIGQFTSEDIHLRGDIVATIKDHEKQYSRRPTQSRIRQILIAQEKLPRMTRQGFHKILKRLFLLGYFRG